MLKTDDNLDILALRVGGIGVISSGRYLTNVILADDLIPDGADFRSIGSTAREILNLYIGDIGKIYFGLAQDVNLYRGAADQLKTDDALEVTGKLTLRGAYTDHRLGSVDYVYASMVNGDSVHRFAFKNDGILEWGSGAAARDVNLYRSAANLLKTDDVLQHIGSGNTSPSFSIETANRSAGTWYQNTGNKTLYVAIIVNGETALYLNAYLEIGYGTGSGQYTMWDDILVRSAAAAGTRHACMLQAPVPPGWYYRLSLLLNSTMDSWREGYLT